jgi:hypothetical protein
MAPNVRPNEAGDGAFMECDLSTMAPWRPTIGQVRKIIESYLIGGPQLTGIVPEEAMQFAPRQREVELIGDMAFEAVKAGRLIDFGELPNALIKDGGHRGGPLYAAGVLNQPFRDPWLLYHTWDERNAAVYLINPCEPDRPNGDCEVVELEPAQFAGQGTLTIGDRILYLPEPEKPDSYSARCAPSIWRFMPGAEAINNGEAPENAAAGNVLDPLMTCLIMLSTNGIERETVRVADKLQRARAKSGKPPIPPYDRVNSAPYVTAMMLRGRPRAGESLGGTHASPVPHIRRGHLRTYASGVQSFIRDTLVGVTEDTRLSWLNRSHYKVRR